MQGFPSVPGSENLMDQSSHGHIMTEWRLGFQLISVFLISFQDLWELLEFESNSRLYCVLFQNDAKMLFH